MKKIIIMIVMTVLMVLGVCSFSACSSKNETPVTPKTFNYEVQTIEDLDVETAKNQLVEKCKESRIISKEIATLRKAEYTENGTIPQIYIRHEGDEVLISNEDSCIDRTTVCEPYMFSVRIQNEPEYSRILLKKEMDSEPVEIILNGSEQADYFHSFKFWDENFYIRKGADLYTLDKENLELILIADDFAKHVVNDKDGQYYYLNTKNQWINTAGEVIEEGVFGVDTNGCSNFKTVLFVSKNL